MWSSPHALCMEHHRPETLTEPEISEKPPVGRQLYSGAPAQLTRGDQSMCFASR